MKKSIKFNLSKILIVLLLFNSFNPALVSAQDAAGQIAKGVIVSQYIKQTTDSISQLIDQLRNVMTDVSFKMINDLIRLQDELKKTADELVGKTFGELTKQQQLFFENTTKHLADMQYSLSQGSDNIKKLSNQAEQMIAQFPFTGKEPRVRDSYPIYLLKPSGKVEVSINGAFLRHGDAKLIGASNISCEKIGHNDNKMIFTCPSEMFPVSEKNNNYISARLIVNNESKLFNFSKSKKTKEFQIPFTVISNQLGEYEITATHLVENKDTVSRSGRWGLSNPHCVERREHVDNFSPQSADWNIDVNSINPVVTSNRRGEYKVQGVSQNGFSIWASARNGGQCIFGGGDGRGWIVGDVYWNETRKTQNQVTSPIDTGVLEWGKAKSFKLPPQLKSFLIKIKQIDGQEIVLNQAIPSKWFKVDKDSADTSLVISPFDLVRAMRTP